MSNLVLRQQKGSPLEWAEVDGNFTHLSESANINYQPAGTGAVATNVQSKLREFVSVKDFGAVGDGVTDDTAALQAFASYLCTNGGRGIFPEGRYRVTNEIDFYRPNSPRIDVELFGAGEFSTVILSDFFGADKSVFKSVDPLNTTRSSPINIFHIGFASVTRTGGVVPCYLDIGGWGESRIGHVRFGASNNTAWRASSMQNIRSTGPITSFFAGKHFLYKATNGITFSASSGGTTVTASASLFTADDVGRILTVLSTAGINNIKYVIASVDSPTQVTVVGTTLAATNQQGHFESARVSIDIATDATLVTANASCFSSSDVGLTVYIRNARSGPWGRALHRAKITQFISATQVRIDTPATRTVSGEYIAVPAVDFWSPEGVSGTLGADSNDVIIDKLQIESFSGVGLVVFKSIFMHIMGKIHGVSSNWSDTQASTNHMWADDYSGTWTGQLDAPCNGDCRIHLSNMNDLMTFPWLGSRRFRQETILIAEEFTDPGGYVEIKSMNTYSAASDPLNLFIDNNTSRRIQFTGLINMLADSQPARKYVGGNVYVVENSLVVGEVSNTTAGNVNVGGADGGRIQVERVGQRRYSLGNNAGTGFTIRDENAGVDRLLIASTGNITPGTNNAQNIGGGGTNRWATINAETLALGSAAIPIRTGTGTPEGVVTAAVGSIFLRTNGGAGTTLYVKESGTGNTGWVAK